MSEGFAHIHGSNTLMPFSDELKDSVKLDSCKFCHTEETKTNVDDRVEKDGYCIVPIENCQNP